MTPNPALPKHLLGIAAGLLLLLSGHPANADAIDRQRELFQQAFESVERGQWQAVDDLGDADRALLQNYVLWPDLRAAWYRATLRDADHTDIERFLERYGTLKPARELRYRYALHLARTGDLDGYLSIYRAFYQGLEIAKLDCIALQAELADGRIKRIVNRANSLWLTGKSQAEECDPVFEYLREQKLLGDDAYVARYELAIEEREFARARWLARSIDPALVDAASLWLTARADPVRFVETHAQRADSETAREQLVYAIERVTYADPVTALRLWQSIDDTYAFSAEDRLRSLRHIALWTARDGLPGAYGLLSGLPLAGRDDDEVMRWRARTSLREQQWRRLLDDIAALSIDERDDEQWRYWRAVALQRSGQSIPATAALAALSGERSYYGFLAADELGSEYRFDHDLLQADEIAIDAMAARADLVRAKELFLVGLDGRGRSEWDAVIVYFTPEEKRQAAILADRWGWHSRAISTAASIGQFDDLALRYPLPWQQTFEQHASSASIPITWAYGIARSESLFMRDVRSSAGAVGLMQLMPATGRSVAREINLPYSGLDTLTDPYKNIRLGTSYLGNMAERYDGNRVLATAAYNAGPHRVDRWLPQSGSVDARIWIENIPYNETRQYVRRVLAAETIFHWRLTGDVQRLSDTLPLVQSTPSKQQLASR